MNDPTKDYDPKVVQDFFDHVYVDRGMVKWQGYYLSDHTSALKKQAAFLGITYPARPLQALEEASAILANAYERHRVVAIQLDETDMNGDFAPDTVGLVSGYLNDSIIINDEQFIKLDTIRNVKYAE